ncbi:hypothetical protein [Pedobacter sp.]
MEKQSNKSAGQKEKLAVKVFRKVGSLMGKAQSVWAEWMNQRTAGLSRRTLYISLILFVAISIAYNSTVLVGGNSASMGFGSIEVPSKAPQPQIIDKAFQAEIKRVKRFTKFMDSLQGSPSGKKTYDSIMKARPGLLDSAKAMENWINNF